LKTLLWAWETEARHEIKKTEKTKYRKQPLRMGNNLKNKPDN
jgi:hypothetical protein